MSNNMKKPNFANGFDYYCTGCSAFFTVRILEEDNDEPRYCSRCGELYGCLTSISALLHFLDDKGIDPSRVYHAFPKDKPIPQSHTGATPLQVDAILAFVDMRRKKNLPITIKNIAGPCALCQETTKKVFQEFDITETGVKEPHKENTT